MAKDLTRHQEGIVKRYYEHQDTIQSNKLSEIVSDLWIAEDEKVKTKLWGRAQMALMRVGVDATQVARVVAKRDLEALAKLVAQADAGKTPPPPADGKDDKDKARNARSLSDGRTVKQALSDNAAEGGYDSLEEANLKRALKTFRRKLKSLRRDDESRLGNRYVTAGRTSTISAITPPTQFPAPVWEKLVELGRLKKAGQGTYELP